MFGELVKFLLNVTEMEMRHVSGDMPFYRNLLASDNSNECEYLLVDPRLWTLRAAPKLAERAAAGRGLQTWLIAGVSGLALWLEFGQILSPGRVPDLVELAASLVGVALGYALFQFWRRAWQ